MAPLGRACLILALARALYGIGASLYGARAGRRDWVDSGRRSVYALARADDVAFVVLEIAFLRSDFSFDVVATHSSTTTPTFYKAAAAWSSQEGSLLLWVWLLSLWSSLVLFLVRRRLRDVAPYATAVLLGFGGVLRRAARLRGLAVRDAWRSAPARGQRPEPAAAPPEHDDPPADAVLGLHAVRDARSRSRSAR